MPRLSVGGQSSDSLAATGIGGYKARMTDVAYRLLATGIVRDPDSLVRFISATYAYATFYEGHVASLE